MKNAPVVGVKYDVGKPMPLLLLSCFPDAIDALIAVNDFGAKKYSPGGWRYVENKEDRYRNALLRHVLKHVKGEMVDAESQMLHDAHAAWNALAVLQIAIERRENGQKKQVESHEADGSGDERLLGALNIGSFEDGIA